MPAPLVRVVEAFDVHGVRPPSSARTVPVRAAARHHTAPGHRPVQAPRLLRSPPMTIERDDSDPTAPYAGHGGNVGRVFATSDPRGPSPPDRGTEPPTSS